MINFVLPPSLLFMKVLVSLRAGKETCQEGNESSVAHEETQELANGNLCLGRFSSKSVSMQIRAMGLASQIPHSFCDTPVKLYVTGQPGHDTG